MQSRTLWFVLLMMSTAADAEDAVVASDTPRVLQKLTAVDDETIPITAQREAISNRGATGLDLSLAETPQSVTVIDEELLQQFGLDDVNQLLTMTTGVDVESIETDRTYYNSRGFDIRSMQIDGMGLPLFFGLMEASQDTALYERVEVVRGANALKTGIGNPSGTVNYQRKRPRNELYASSELTLGSWNRKRLEADVSVPLTDDGRWAVRGVGVYEDKDTWLSLYHQRRKVAYGVMDGQIGDRLTLMVGYSHHDSAGTGVLWGALPLLYSDGTPTDFDVSTSTSMDWTSWDASTDSAFATAQFALSSNWKLTSTAQYDKYTALSDLFYTYGSLDRTTGKGLYGYPGSYTQHAYTFVSDTSVAGPFDLFGQRHDATLGLNVARSSGRYYQRSVPSNDPAWGAMSSFPGWSGTEVARPAFGNATLKSEWDVRMSRVYGATRLSITDAVKLIAGFNAVDFSVDGYSWGVSSDQAEKAVTPYVGFTWRVLPSTNAYLSYSDIFEPQSDIGKDLKPIGSAKGRSLETGVKRQWLENRLLTTLALFRSTQNNIAEEAGTILDSSQGSMVTYYKGITAQSTGYELEIAGSPHRLVKLQGGYTHFKFDDSHGQDVRTYVPRSTLKLMASINMPGLEQLELGASARWQSRIYTDTTDGRAVQQGYAIYGMNARYDINKQFALRASIDNLTDKKHWNSFYWGQSYYGAPRSFNASATWKYQ